MVVQSNLIFAFCLEMKMVNSITYEDFYIELKNGTFFKFKYKEYEVIFNLNIKGYFKVKIEWVFRLFKNGEKNL